MKKGTLHIILALLALQACVSKPDDIPFEPDSEALAVVAEIGQNLSVESDGIVSSIYDATASLSQSGLNPNEVISKQIPNNNHGRGNDSNFQVSFTVATGVHRIQFNRFLETDSVTKNLNADLKYIYKDENGNFVFFPVRQQDKISSIQHYGIKTGQMTYPRGQSGFIRVDSLFLQGFGRPTGGIFIRGKQKNRGFLEHRVNNETVFRYYESSYFFKDVEIARLSVQNRDLSKALRGSMDYTFLSKKVVGADTLTTKFNGNIEFTGDGKAILRSKAFREPFLIDLIKGIVLRPGQKTKGRNGKP